MKKLMALLLYHTHGVHLLHWNLVGDDFHSNHVYLGELYEEMAKHVDTVTEIAMQHGYMPLTYKEVLDYLVDSADTFTDVKNEHVSSQSAYTSVAAMYQEIMEAFHEVYEDSEISRCNISELESIEAWYSLAAKYLLDHQLTKA